MINQNITEENRITFDNPYKFEYKHSPNTVNHKTLGVTALYSWFYVEDGCLYEKYYSEIFECESKTLIKSYGQLPPNMLIGEINDLQQIMYAFGEGNFEISQ